MRMNELTRYLDKYVDFDSIGEKIDTLQERLAKLRAQLPEVPLDRVRGYVPKYSELRDRLPHARKPRSYTMPAVLAAGGIAILGAIVVTAVMMSDASRRTPKSNDDMH